MMKDIYRTISESSEGLFKEKGSRFISFAFPVDTEEMIKQHLSELRKHYHDARHHCYAWRLGADMKRFRSNDDGEPAGSAGNPILGQIRSRNLTNVLVAVVRYFGGTLLGVGGLINAYRSAASDALERTLIIQQKVYSRWQVQFGYPQMNEVMKVVKEHGLILEGQHFDLDCTLTLHVWKREEQRVEERLFRIEGCTLNIAD
jgi:uncharacterized YigZ family protein